MNTEPNTLITTRGEFHAALKFALSEAATHGGREIWLCDNDFSDWPLGERTVVDDLMRWAASNRKLTLVARNFDAVARQHPRWVEWRRQWSHIVSCRSNGELEADGVPTVLLVPGKVSVRLSDTVLYRGRLAYDRAEEVRCREMIDAVLQRSEEAFPVTTTGL